MLIYCLTFTIVALSAFMAGRRYQERADYKAGHKLLQECKTKIAQVSVESFRKGMLMQRLRVDKTPL